METFRQIKILDRSRIKRLSYAPKCYHNLMSTGMRRQEAWPVLGVQRGVRGPTRGPGEFTVLIIKGMRIRDWFKLLEEKDN